MFINPEFLKIEFFLNSQTLRLIAHQYYVYLKFFHILNEK